jgi:C-terminal processing protease CtpA/Prc
MWDWERASVPYQPIHRRRLLRRRVLTLLIAALIVVPYYLYHHQRAVEPVGARVFDQVVSTIAIRYFDRSYHGIAWRAAAERYRPLVVNAATTQARYAALRSMISLLRDSHTAVYSPDDLQPRRDERRHEVFGMSPDASSDGPAIDWRTIKPGIGYVRIASFPDAMNDVLAWAMSDLVRDRALILDLRGNPGGLVDSVDEVAGVFLPQGSLISSGTRRYHVFGPQEFRATDDSGAHFSGRLVVLVDSQTRSGAESLARALQYYHRATLVGTRTAGKVLGVDAEITLDDGGLLRVATLDMRDPSGQRLEGRGVRPDRATTTTRTTLVEAIRLCDRR